MIAKERERNCAKYFKIKLLKLKNIKLKTLVE